MKHYLAVLIGPTAIGKTRMSLEIAKTFGTEIISADSRQFYKEMQIGTAVPTDDELKVAPHHFIQHRSIKETYDVGDFEKDTLQKLDVLFKDKPLAVMVGGSGLYVKAVCEGLDNFPKVNPEIRENLNKKFEKEGIESLQNELQKRDPNYAKQVDMQNYRRLIRALEICMETGQTYSHFLNQPKTKRSFTPLKIGLTAPREIIYKRIEKRVDQMMAEGLLEEVEKLYPLRHYNALNTIGYRELFSYIKGECSLEFAISEIKKNTRRFAKRQLTWFKRDPSIRWFHYDSPVQEAIDYIDSKME